jgi:multiple sugar transport system ATP-binding protein
MNFIEAMLIRQGDAYFIDTPGFKVRLPASFYPAIEPYANRTVIFGVRPEDMATHDPSVSNGGNIVTARTDVVETLGSETFVYLTCGPHSIIARMETPERVLTVGQAIEVALKMPKTHIFDKATSQTIV